MKKRTSENERKTSPAKRAPRTKTGATADATVRKRPKAAPRDGEERFRMLADSAPVLIWVNGPDGCESVNREYLEFLGAGEADVRGYGWSQFVHPDDREAYVNAYLETASLHSRFEAEFRFRRRDGEYRWMRTVGMPRVEGGEFKGYSGSTYDITESKRAEARLREDAEIIETINRTGRVISAELNLQGVVQEVTDAATELVGAADAAEVPQSPDLAQDRLRDLRVLVVDDDPDARDLFNLILTSYGAEVRDCASAHEALQILDEWGPDVLVSDIGMPVEDGYELMRKVRALEPERGGLVPALALTAYARAEDARRAFNVGFQAHIPKPVEPGELAMAVAGLAGRGEE
jgi:PAS domain S-box-containing protein